MTAVLRLPPRERAELDNVMIEAARRGEPWAHAVVLGRYAKPVWSLVSRILGRAGRGNLAEDVTQEALCASLRSLARFPRREPSRVSGWILTIAARTALSELRKRRDALPIEDHEPRSDDRPDQSVERRALGLAIASAVEELGPEIRAAFVLRAYHEFGYEEIADALGIDIGTVKSRLWRARAALRQSLAEVHHGS